MGVPTDHFMGQTIASGSTAIAAGSIQWIATTNSILQMIATVIAIVAGLLTIYPIVKRWLSQRRSSRS